MDINVFQRFDVIISKLFLIRMGNASDNSPRKCTHVVLHTRNMVTIVEIFNSVVNYIKIDKKILEANHVGKYGKKGSPLLEPIDKSRISVSKECCPSD